MITDFLPVQQVQACQFPLHISYFLQKCKKGKLGEMDLPLLKNDITTSEPAFGIANIIAEYLESAILTYLKIAQ